jgi:stage II sporulation protein D
MSKARAASAALGVVLLYAATGSSCRSAPSSGPVLGTTPGPVAVASPPERVRSDLPGAPAEPALRVGLTTEARRASLGADGGVIVLAGPALVEGGARSSVARASFVPAEAAQAAQERYRVQVASLADEAAARQMARLAEDALRQPSIVRFNPQTRSYQVRVGEFATREQAQAAAGALRRAGLSGSWVTEERPAGAPGRVRLLETGQELEVATIAPGREGDLLSLDGANYRGWLEVRANAQGALTVINIVNVEDYLRGVVPNELSPAGFPQIEALKAQAIAARTYALRNRGQFQDKGYDLCATPACQVYKGQSSEHPLSDRAVRETEGLVAMSGGRLINSMYTSTCGGHTEDGENIFEGEPLPYLRGVACLPERSAFSVLRAGPPARAPSVGRDAALLASLGVLDARRGAGQLEGPAREGEVRAWTTRTLVALHRQGCASGPDEALGQHAARRDSLPRSRGAELGGTVAAPPSSTMMQRGAFYRFLVGSLCWEERAKRLLAPGDSDYLLQVEDKGDLSGDATRLAVTVLMQEGLVSPFPDNTLRLLGALTREELVGLLARAVAKVGAPDWVSAEFRSASGNRLEVKHGETLESYTLASDARLFRDLDGSRAAVSELSMLAGDEVSFVAKDGLVRFLEAHQSRLGPAADRSSRYYRWEVRLAPAEIERAAQPGLGQVLDVQPRRLGVSGRVVELAILGSSGEQLVKGLKIRSLLGLRENLFVIDRERDVSGAVQRFVFTGKGWGHGVGLCQVGASGMAQAGATYEEILKHYYTGIHLERAY